METLSKYFCMGMGVLVAACATPSGAGREYNPDLSLLRQVNTRPDSTLADAPRVDNAANTPGAPARTPAEARLEGWSFDADPGVQDPEKRGASQDPELKRLERRVQELESLFGGDRFVPASLQEGGAAPGEDDATGTDPRAFGTKFMPYYRFTELDNEIQTNELVLFGLVRFADNLALTYELPVAKHIDYSDFGPFQAGMGIPPNQGGGGLPPGGVPFSSLEADGDNAGIGDLNVRLFVKNDALRWDNPIIEEGSTELMPILETTIPTASQDILGSEALIVSPGFAFVMDMPAMGFLALMNFYDFHVWKDRSRGDVNRYRGRWFYMQPITPPAFVAAKDPDIPDFGILSGIYVMPEFQPVFDFETDHFSFWVGPEIGKVVSEGQIFYIKPGFGVDAEGFDRKFTAEVGWRYFF